LAQPRTAGVKLVRTVPVGVAALKLDREALQPRQQSFVATLDLLQSPELYRRVAQASLSLTADEVATHSRIHTNSASDPITVTFHRRNPAEAVALANLYAREAVRLSTEQQRDELKEMQSYLRATLADTDRD